MYYCIINEIVYIECILYVLYTYIYINNYDYNNNNKYYIITFIQHTYNNE